MNGQLLDGADKSHWMLLPASSLFYNSLMTRLAALVAVSPACLWISVLAHAMAGWFIIQPPLPPRARRGHWWLRVAVFNLLVGFIASSETVNTMLLGAAAVSRDHWTPCVRKLGHAECGSTHAERAESSLTLAEPCVVHHVSRTICNPNVAMALGTAAALATVAVFFDERAAATTVAAESVVSPSTPAAIGRYAVLAWIHAAAVVGAQSWLHVLFISQVSTGE